MFPILLPLDVPVVPGPTESVQVAEALYGPAPCGTPTVLIHDPGPDVRFAEGVTVVDGWVSGLGAADCVINVTPAAVPVLCPVVVHEFRHLLGQDHDDAGVTGPRRVLEDVPSCYPFRTVYVPFRAWDALTAEEVVL